MTTLNMAERFTYLQRGTRSAAIYRRGVCDYTVSRSECDASGFRAAQKPCRAFTRRGANRIASRWLGGEAVIPPMLAAGLLHDQTCEARIERAARDLLMDALGAIYDLGGCDGTCGTTGQCVAKRIRAYLADDQEDTT